MHGVRSLLDVYFQIFDHRATEHFNQWCTGLEATHENSISGRYTK